MKTSAILSDPTNVEGARYKGAHIGGNRDLTDNEKEKIIAAAGKVTPSPPWTPKAMTANRAFRGLLLELFEDGVSARTVGEVLHWDRARVAMHLRQGRQEGLGTGTRRYIPSVVNTFYENIKRNLKDEERSEIEKLLEVIPKTASSRPRWTSSQGQDLIFYIKELQEDNVPLPGIAAMLNMTKQGLSLHLTKAVRSESVDEDVERRSLTPGEAKRLQRKYIRMPESHNGAKTWSSEAGIRLIDEIIDLQSQGVPIASVYAQNSTGRVSKKIIVQGVDGALGIKSTVIGRMVGMRDRFTSRI